MMSSATQVVRDARTPPPQGDPTADISPVPTASFATAAPDPTAATTMTSPPHVLSSASLAASAATASPLEATSSAEDAMDFVAITTTTSSSDFTTTGTTAAGLDVNSTVPRVVSGLPEDGLVAAAAPSEAYHHSLTAPALPTTSQSSAAAGARNNSIAAAPPAATALPRPRPAPDRRQKRLERNRESARLSRRRRKQYLEVLEERVTQLSEETDGLRRRHVNDAVASIRQQRARALDRAVHHADATLHPSHSQPPLPRALARASSELVLAATFRTQQLRSMVAPSSTQFVLWLTLQNDAFFRGGRAASERLSAARIGERMLQSGNDKVAPVQSMWPLVCNEVCLSYEQEERVRLYQRNLLQAAPSWLDRHTAYATGKVLTSSHRALQAVALRAGQRERAQEAVLQSPAQRRVLNQYLQRKRSSVLSSITKRMAAARLAPLSPYTTDSQQHVAANLYILRHQHDQVLKRLSPAAPLVTGLALKKLTQRPCFETLGARSAKMDGKDNLKRSDGAHASSGSLKRSASEMSMDGTGSASDGGTEDGTGRVTHVSPTEAQTASLPTVQQTLGHVQALLPPMPQVAVAQPIFTTTTAAAAAPMPAYVSSAPLPYQTPAPPSACVLQQHQAPQPAPMPSVPHVTYVPQHHAAAAQQPPAAAASAVYYSTAASPAVRHVSSAPHLSAAHAGAPVAAPVLSAPPAAASAYLQTEQVTAAAAGQAPAKHQRTSSFLPAHLNVVPEEMWPMDGSKEAEEFLMELADEDWAVGGLEF